MRSDLLRWSSRRTALAVAVIMAAVSLQACGGTTLRPLPSPDGLGLRCESAYVLGSELERPSRIQIRNETEVDLRVVLDQCDRNEHLGWVRSGATAAFALPDKLVRFPDGLRIHAYRGEKSGERFGSYGVEPAGLIARLVVSAPAG